MQISIETGNTQLPNNSRASLEQRILKKLGRLADRVLFLRVSMNTTSQKKGRKCSECKFSAQLATGGQIIVVQHSRNMARAFFKGIRRLCRLVKKQPRRARIRQTLQLAPEPI